jgi:hypothetical protein
MFVLVICTMASVGRSIRGSGTSDTLTFRGPLYTSAFMATHFFGGLEGPTHAIDRLARLSAEHATIDVCSTAKIAGAGGGLYPLTG